MSSQELKAENERLFARVAELEEENRVLKEENRVLKEKDEKVKKKNKEREKKEKKREEALEARKRGSKGKKDMPQCWFCTNAFCRWKSRLAICWPR
jgi:hypothetical protein